MLVIVYTNLEAGTFRKDGLDVFLRTHTAPLDG